MKVQAIFIGTDSLGYVNKREYDLFLMQIREEIVIKRTDETGICLYDSMKKFLENWSTVTLISN